MPSCSAVFDMGSALALRGFPSVTRVLAMAMPPGWPLGVYGSPPVGSWTSKLRTAAWLPSHGSRAIGCGFNSLFFFRLFLTVFSLISEEGMLSGDVVLLFILHPNMLLLSTDLALGPLELRLASEFV